MRTWRTLVRVVEVKNGMVVMVVPGWNHKYPIVFSPTELPNEIVAVAKEGRRFHARVNLGAEKREDLVFTDWETE